MLSENGITLELEQELLDRLDRMGVVYRCSDCDCCANYHLTVGLDWCDFDLAMVQIEMDERQYS